MTYRFLFLLLFNSIMFSSLQSQEIKLDKNFIDSIQYKLDFLDEKNNYNTLKAIKKVYNFNRIKISLNQIDTIKVYRENKTIYGLYRDHRIRLGGGEVYKKNLLEIYGNGGNSFSSKSCPTDSTCVVLKMDNQGVFKEDPLIKIENYFNGVLYGEYIEHTKSKKLIVTGNYMLKDSIHTKIYSYFNPRTYEEEIDTVQRNHIAVKCGQWVRRNLDGQVVEIKNEVKCKEE